MEKMRKKREGKVGRKRKEESGDGKGVVEGEGLLRGRHVVDIAEMTKDPAKEKYNTTVLLD
jgi:hypothetical protein